MANRYMVRNYMTLEKGPVALYGRVAVGAAGAPTLSGINSKGILSIVRTAAGAYTVSLGSAVGVDTYQRLLIANAQSVNAAPSWAAMHVVADNSATLATPNVQIKFFDYAGAAVDPANGETLLLELVFSNSTAT